MAVPANFKTGFVTAVGSDGHGSLGRPLEWLYWGNQANLHINGIPSPAKNQDIRLSRLHPVVGQPLRAEFRVSNRGFQSAASRIRLTVKATDDSAPIVKEIETEPIVPGKENWAPFELVPISCGKNLVTVEVICPDDGDQSDNRLAFPLYVTRKPLFFLWYGFAEDLEVANLAAPSAAYKEDWRRRGALSLPIVSRKDTPQGDAYLSAMKGNDGFQYDELGGTWNAELFLPRSIIPIIFDQIEGWDTL